MNDENQNKENETSKSEIDETQDKLKEESVKTQKVETSEAENEGEEVPENRVLAVGDAPDFKWYVAHVLTGQENKVCKTLLERIVNLNMTEYFSEMVVPEESVTTHAGGKKRTIRKKFFPGYVLLKMIMNDHSWHLVKDTDKISGFVGGTKDIPSPISEEEAEYMLGQMKDGFKRVKTSSSFSEGDSVKVVEGPFASFIGTVEGVTDKKIKVQVSIFGRLTPVELDFSQVEKV